MPVKTSAMADVLKRSLVFIFLFFSSYTYLLPVMIAPGPRRAFTHFLISLLDLATIALTGKRF